MLDTPVNSTKASRSSSATAQFFEYSAAANPIRPSLTPAIPHRLFPASLHQSGPTRIVPLDLSGELKCQGPATAPGLCAHFIRIEAGETVRLDPNATSQVCYVIRGSGQLRTAETGFEWSAGDFFTMPGGSESVLSASSDAALYYVNDAPLLTYLGARVEHCRFQATLYTAEQADRELERISGEPGAAERSRISVLLGNEEFPLTRTVTHVLRAMYGIVPAHSAQKPHRHQSVALDFIVDCEPGCYSLVGPQLTNAGDIHNPVRVDWQPGSVFVTPPGHWHAHYNETDRPARLIPIQDAGLQTYLRTLDIRFA